MVRPKSHGPGLGPLARGRGPGRGDCRHELRAVRLGGEDVLVGMPVRLATDPGYRGRGIFRDLEHENEARAEANGIRLLVTVPNAASTPVFLRRLGWTRLAPLRVWARPRLGFLHRRQSAGGGGGGARAARSSRRRGLARPGLPRTGAFATAPAPTARSSTPAVTRSSGAAVSAGSMPPSSLRPAAPSSGRFAGHSQPQPAPSQRLPCRRPARSGHSPRSASSRRQRPSRFSGGRSTRRSRCRSGSPSSSATWISSDVWYLRCARRRPGRRGDRCRDDLGDRPPRARPRCGRVVRPCVLGYRRLAVIDLVTGASRSRTRPDDVVAVFNGELYNFRELRSESTRRPRHPWTGDTPALPHPYEEMGSTSSAARGNVRDRTLGPRAPAPRPRPRPLWARSHSSTRSCLTAARLRVRDEGAASAPRAPAELDLQAARRLPGAPVRPAPRNRSRRRRKVPAGSHRRLRGRTVEERSLLASSGAVRRAVGGGDGSSVSVRR